MSDTKSTPDGDGRNVDETLENGSASRARAKHVARIPPGAEGVFALADEIATDSRLLQMNAVRDIILADPRVRVQLVAAAIRCLFAEKFYFDRAAKEVVHEPDYSTQMKAVAWLAAYSDGLPVQTNLNLNANTNPTKGLPPEEVLMRSPAALEAMKRTIARIEAANTKKPAEKAAVPV